MATSLGQRIRIIRRLLRRSALRIIMLVTRYNPCTLRSGLHNTIRHGKRAITLRRYSHSSAHGHITHTQVIYQRVKTNCLPMAITGTIMNVSQHEAQITTRQCTHNGSSNQTPIEGHL